MIKPSSSKSTAREGTGCFSEGLTCPRWMGILPPITADTLLLLMLLNHIWAASVHGAVIELTKTSGTKVMSALMPSLRCTVNCNYLWKRCWVQS